MEQLFDLSLLNATLRMVTPILLAALGGAICARVGLFNVGLEGFVLMGAFFAIVGNYFTGNLFLAILIAMLGVVLFSLIFGYLSIHLQANVIVVGIALNFLALGLTTFGLRTIFNVKGAFYDPAMQGLPNWHIPVIEQIPWIGKVISGHSPLVYLAFILVVVLYFFLFKTIMGFRYLAVGENITGAASMGIKVKGIQYGAVCISGLLCALAGAQLSLGQVTMFSEGMTAGRGFISLVAMMLGQSHPVGVMLSSLLFGFMDALSFRLQAFQIPTQFTYMVPYVMTLVAMFIFRKKAYLQNVQQNDGGAK